MVLQSSVGWFNLAATILVESRKTKFIFLIRGIEFTKPDPT